VQPIPPSSCDLHPLSFEQLNTNLNKHEVEDDLPNLQDDELKKDSSKVNTIFYRDSVDSLTDKNFEESISSMGLTVVFFHAEFDSASILFQPVFAKINDDLGEFSNSLCWNE